MPIHHVSRATLHEDLQDIERRQGERVMSITPDPEDGSRFLVITEYQTIETRAVS